MTSVALYGGAFDPPHQAHVFAISYLMTREDVDEVWLLPTGQHAFGKVMASYNKRVEMLDILIRQMGWGKRVSVSTREAEHKTASYTYDTLSGLQQDFPNHNFILVIGADNLSAAHRWHRFDELTSKWALVVLGRTGHEASLDRYKGEGWCHVGPTLPEVSSTLVRMELQRDAHSVWLPDILLPIAQELYPKSTREKGLTAVQIFGYGRAGAAFTHALRRRGVEVAVWNRTPRPGVDLSGALPATCRAQFWLLCVDDVALAAFVDRLAAKYQKALAGHVVLHCAGRLDSAVLAPLAKSGATVGSCHPCLSLSGQAALTPGGWYGVEGDPDAVAWAFNLIKVLEGRGVQIPAGAKVLYHAAAVLAGNFLTTLTHGGIELLQTLEFAEPDARALLVKLQMTALQQLTTEEAPVALTGPFARGDFEAIGTHVTGLASASERVLELYRVLAEQTAEMMNWGPDDKARLQAMLASSDQSDRLEGKG